MMRMIFLKGTRKTGCVLRHARTLFCLWLFALMVAAAASNAKADPVLVFNESTGTTVENRNQSVGWQFNVLNSLTVTGLGWYDRGANGLSVAHRVGIWAPNGSLLASVVVPAGTTAPLDGLFRTIAVTPIVLPAGTGYIIGGEDFLIGNTDRLAFDTTQSVDPRLVYVNATFGLVGAGFVRPTSFAVATTGFYGPSFSVEAIPEPTTMLLLGTGLVGVAASMRKRRTR